MDEQKAYLTEWITHFLKHRNAIFKTIDSIAAHDKYDLLIKHKTKDQYAIISPNLESGTIKQIPSEEHILMVCFNTEENFQFLLENWKLLATFPNLTCYFVNPLSEPDKKWIIAPYVHQKIADNVSLKTGLRAMFETVMPISDDRIKSLIKQKE